ncbi:MAG: type IX secretion system membrane protein PorP/SprF [Saprospiraceae bacterium]
MQKIFIVIIIIFLSNFLNGQDQFRYTLFDYSPISLNPANAGSFEGTVRVGTLLREQDYGLKFGQYQSPIVYLDAPIIRGFRKMDWVGFGFSFQHDQQINGTQVVDGYTDPTYYTNQTTTTVIGGLTYHLSLDKKRKNIIGIGFQTGNSSVYFTSDEWRLGSTILNWLGAGALGSLGTESIQETPLKADPQSLNLGYSVGITYTSNLNKTDYFKTGFSVAHIGKYLRNSIINSGGGSSLYKKYTAFGIYRQELDGGLILEPRFIFEYMKPSLLFGVQMLTGLKLTKPSLMTLYGGLGYNYPNGLQVLLSTDIKDLKIGFSFDINLSDKINATGANGAFEIGASYILKIRRKPIPDPVLVCPQL